MTYTTEEIQELYNSFSAEEKEQLELAVQTRNERKGIAENKDPLTELIDYSEDYGIELTANPFDVFQVLLQDKKIRLLSYEGSLFLVKKQIYFYFARWLRPKLNNKHPHYRMTFSCWHDFPQKLMQCLFALGVSCQKKFQNFL